MSKPSQETLASLEGVRTEAGANMTLVPTDEYNRGFNAGIAEVIKFVRRYERGEGLFHSAAENKQPK